MTDLSRNDFGMKAFFVSLASRHKQGGKMDWNISEISFPGLGIGPFEINNTAFTLFGLEVKWYGIIICLGIISGFLYFMFRAKQNGIVEDTVLDITLVTVPVAVIGARIYFVVFYGVPLRELFAIRNGGLAIYGGVIFGVLAVLIMTKIKKLKFFAFADMIIPGVMLGQIIGRWGNFTNGEAFGSETESLFRMGLCNHNTGFETLFVHPTFLYESLWNLVGFILINVFYKKKKFNGEIFLWYAGWYGLGRTFIELLRTDSLYLGGIRVSSLVGLVCFAVALPLVITLRVKRSQKVKAGVLSGDGVSDISDILGFAASSGEEVPAETAEESGSEQTEESDSAEKDDEVEDDYEDETDDVEDIDDIDDDYEDEPERDATFTIEDTSDEIEIVNDKPDEIETVNDTEVKNDDN